MDRDGALADFSSRGPRVGDGGLKPDITAPGVDIVAAAAATVSAESADAEFGDDYMAVSGTSMAAPHAAGAAALLAQRHRHWRAGELKAALMASADPVPAGDEQQGSVRSGGAEQSGFEQGAGRLDIERAIGQSVFARPAVLNVGTSP